MRVKLDKIVHYNKGERGRVAVIVPALPIRNLGRGHLFCVQLLIPIIKSFVFLAGNYTTR